jgi:uncharacterized protein (DUF433 family)
MADALRGAYTSRRAAALAGVPLSTVGYWATHDVVGPSLSKTRPRLWTFSDVVALRIVFWLRHEKPTGAISPMPEVRRALRGLRTVGAQLGSPDTSLRVDRGGRIYISVTDDSTWRPIGRHGTTVAGVLSEVLEPLTEYVDAMHRTRGPDLRTPRPQLRIIPGKLSGEPHIAGTRIGSETIAALVHDEGLEPAKVVRLYPGLTESAVRECVDLEEQLGQNLLVA